MDRWKVTKDKRNRIHVRKDINGRFKSRASAEKFATRMAKNSKTIMIVHDNNDRTVSDYADFLTLTELKTQQYAEMKMAEAELTVARIGASKWKKAYHRAKNEQEKLDKRKRYEQAKKRLNQEKINLKRAKKKYSDILD